MNFHPDTAQNTLFEQPPPTQEEAVALNIRRLAGDSKARDRLITGSTRLVARGANRFLGFGVPPEDLFGAGMVGLIKAVDSYHHEKGSFASWVSLHVSSSISDELAKLRHVVSMPRRAYGDLFEINRMAQEGGAPQSLQSICAETGFRPDRVLSMLAVGKPPLRLDGPAPGANADSSQGSQQRTLAEAIEDPSAIDPRTALETEDTRRHLRAQVATLEPRRRTVVEMEYGFKGPARNHREIAKALNVTPRRVSQLAEDALAQLRTQVAA